MTFLVPLPPNVSVVLPVATGSLADWLLVRPETVRSETGREAVFLSMSRDLDEVEAAGVRPSLRVVEPES